MRPLCLCLLALALAAAPVLASPGVSDDEWKKAMRDFKDDFKKKSIAFKKRAIEALPLTDERTIEFIIKSKYKLLNSKDWWIRATAAERLSKIRRTNLRKKLLSYATDGDRLVREGVIAALAMSSDPKLDPPVIMAALDDKDWQIRRMACFAAGQQRMAQAVTKMIGMIHWVSRGGIVQQEGEQHPRVHSVLLFNLYEITGKFYGTDVQQWKLYWDKHKDRELPPVKRFDTGSFDDIELEFNDTFARAGSGPLVLVLPQVFKTTTYYWPYFSQLLFVQFLYINLPPMAAFPDLARDADGDMYYPIERLVDALEEMRKKRNVEKTAILAHGFTTWIAAKYAQKYPDRVSGLILLNPYASNKTFSKRVDEAMRSGDPDAEFWAKVTRKQIKPTTALEREKLGYYRDSAALKNKAELEIAMLRRIWHDPRQTEGITIPDFDIRGEEKSSIPALMFFSPKSNKLTGADDIKKLKRYYRRNITVRLRKSARLPFMEEPELFEEALRKFVDKYNLE